MFETEEKVDDRNRLQNLTSHSLEVDPSLFENIHLLPDSLSLYWSTPDGIEIIGKGVASEFSGSGPERYKQIEMKCSKYMKELNHDSDSLPSPLNSFLPGLFGGFSFFDSTATDPVWNDFPPAYFFLPQILLLRQNQDCYGVVTGEDNRIDGLLASLQNPSDLSDSNRSTSNSRAGFPDISRKRNVPEEPCWKQNVTRLLKEINNGQLKKAVLTRKQIIEYNHPFKTGQILSRIRGNDPTSVRFLFQPGGEGLFVGSSPEKLITRRGNNVFTESLAGTAQTGTNKEQNQSIAKKLTQNRKNQNEHSLVVKDIRNRLKTFTRSLNVEEQTVRSFPGVQHLYTPISGTLNEDIHVLSLAEELHPTPAVGGVPRDSALDILREIESISRGWYSGLVGWFNADGEGSFSVAIRSSAILENEAHLFAGAGIVEGSSPDKEWDETGWKFETMMNLLNPSS